MDVLYNILTSSKDKLLHLNIFYQTRKDIKNADMTNKRTIFYNCNDSIRKYRGEKAEYRTV